ILCREKRPLVSDRGIRRILEVASAAFCPAPTGCAGCDRDLILRRSDDSIEHDAGVAIVLCGKTRQRRNERLHRKTVLPALVGPRQLATALIADRRQQSIREDRSVFRDGCVDAVLTKSMRLRADMKAELYRVTRLETSAQRKDPMTVLLIAEHAARRMVE